MAYEFRYSGTGITADFTNSAILQTILRAQLFRFNPSYVVVTGDVFTDYIFSFGLRPTGEFVDISAVRTALSQAFSRFTIDVQEVVTVSGGGTTTPTTSGGGGTTTPTTGGGGGLPNYTLNLNNVLSSILTGGGTTGTTYTVKSGDTLSKIAAKFKTTVAALAALNGIQNVNVIRVGQVLKISGGGSSVQTQTQPQGQTQPAQNQMPNTLPATNPQPQPQPQPQSANWYDAFYNNAGLTGIGIAGLILVGGIILIESKKK
jgi:LysM repeat protein